MIVELPNTYDSWLQLFCFVRDNDHLLPDPLSKHVRLEDYCRKLLDLGRVFVFYDDETLSVISGICMGYINDTINHKAHLQVIIVNQLFQRKGIGEKLIKHFIAQSEESLMNEVVLTCDVSNSKAGMFYSKMGFHQSETNHPNPKKRFLVYTIHE